VHKNNNHPGHLKQNFESFLSTGVGVKFKVFHTCFLYQFKNVKFFCAGPVSQWFCLFIMTVNWFSGTAHCADMYPSSPSDPPQLVAARRKIGDLIGRWLDEDSV
jgi:hypothetical protein